MRHSITVTEKICEKCQLLKPIDEFYLQIYAADGHRSICKDCLDGKAQCCRCGNIRYRNKGSERIHFINNKPYCETCWFIKNKELYRLAYQKGNKIRTSRIKQNGGFCTPEQKIALIQYYSLDGKCLACGNIKELVLDHVIPVSLGGDSWPSNLQPICFQCNGNKGTKIIDYRPDHGDFAYNLLSLSTLQENNLDFIAQNPK